MSDLISRQAAIDALDSIGSLDTDADREYARGIFNALPSADVQPVVHGKWIPVSERLLEKNGVYIVSYEDAVTWLEWFNGKWFFYPSNPAREETGTIIAWMPLPPVYRGDEK